MAGTCVATGPRKHRDDVSRKFPIRRFVRAVNANLRLDCLIVSSRQNRCLSVTDRRQHSIIDGDDGAIAGLPLHFVRDIAGVLAVDAVLNNKLLHSIGAMQHDLALRQNAQAGFGLSD